MSKTKFFIIVAVFAALAGTAAAAPGRGGGGRPGGGGAPHGGAHFGGGAHGGGGMRMGGGGAHFGGGGMRGGGGARFAARPSFHGQRSVATHGSRFAGHGPAMSANRNPGFSGNRNAAKSSPNRRTTARSRAVHNALNSRAVAGALHNAAALRHPNTRARIAATAAMAGWHDGRNRDGWWRHRNGGYGWVGPLFWPFAYDDIYDYTLWGSGYDDPFWDYGYGDIYAGMFSPYGYDDLAGYWPQGSGGSQANAGQTQGSQTTPPDQLAQMCGQDSRDIAGLPIDQIRLAIQPNDAQRAALDDLANASAKAAQDIKAACPSQVALTAPARLAAMQTRIEAMISAVGTVQPPLQKFYVLLNDDQKVRLNALGQDERRDQRKDQRRPEAANNNNVSLAGTCGTTQANVAAWPSAEIEAKVHPTEAQRASLAALQDATAKAADALKTSCPTSEDAITPTARLQAAGKRLDVMLQAVKSVRAALDDFYAKLSDEQKAQFEAIGPSRSASADQSSVPATHHHYRRHASVGGMVRRLISIVR